MKDSLLFLGIFIFGSLCIAGTFVPEKHILSIANPRLPRWGVAAKTITFSPDMKFFNLTWKIRDNAFVTQFDEIWSERSKILYYAPDAKKLPGQAAFTAYRKLPQTNFPTPYAATNPFDDFADSFANYVHVVRLKKPWQIQISSSKEQITLPACWSEPRCREKRKVIEQIFFSADSGWSRSILPTHLTKVRKKL